MPYLCRYIDVLCLFKQKDFAFHALRLMRISVKSFQKGAET